MSKHYSSDKTGYWLIGGISVIVILVIVGGVWLSGKKQQAFAQKSSRDVALTCTTDMATKFHIHPNLEIVINGQRQEIPANIGVTPICMNAIHTHDTAGTLHVESPAQKDFTVGDFFAVWGKPFSKDQVLDSKVDDAHIIRITVNGTEVQGYENTVMHDKDRIVISYEEKK